MNDARGSGSIVLVAHGSSDPRARAVADDTRAALAAAAGMPVLLGLLDHGAPTLEDALADAAGPVVVVPWILATAYHVRVDIESRVAAVGRPGQRVAAALVPHPGLMVAARDRLSEAGVDAHTPVVLAAAGTTDPQANAATAAVARALSDTGRRVVTGYVAGGVAAAEPTIAQALSEAGPNAAVLTWLLAPGRMADLVARAAGDRPCSDPLGSHPGVVAALLERARSASRPQPRRRRRGTG